MKKSSRRSLLLAVCVWTLGLATALWAEDIPQPVSAAPVAAPITPEAVTAPGHVTLDFKDADIQNVLRILSLKSGVNIVAGKDVTGVVTIRLVDVPWEKALDVVLKTYGYAYDRDGNIIRVATLENLKLEELSTQVFVLNYASAAEMEKAVANVLSERGKVKADPRSNTLIITDSPNVLSQVREVIERLDKPTPQVSIEAKVIEILLGDSDKMGIKWNMTAGLTGAAVPTTFPFDSIRKGILPSPYNRFLTHGRAAVTTVTTGSGTSGSSTAADFPGGFDQPTFPVIDKEEFKFGTLDFSQFQAVLEFIETHSDARILSQPHVVTMNNKEAKILVGEVIGIPTFERNSTTGRMEVTGYEDRDVGIRLTVTPQVNSSGEILVDLHPEITTLIGFDLLTADIRTPHFSTREAKTQVRIKDGQTIVVGGLIRENKVNAKVQVPLLGNVPLIGRLFTHRDDKIEKTDLLFFITVHIVKEEPLIPAGHKL